MGIIRDIYEEIKAAVQKAYEKSDIVLITGGTSAGFKDMTAKIIEELGSPGVLFHGVSIKPGKLSLVESVEINPFLACQVILLLFTYVLSFS